MHVFKSKKKRIWARFDDSLLMNRIGQKCLGSHFWNWIIVGLVSVLAACAVDCCEDQAVLLVQMGKNPWKKNRHASWHHHLLAMWEPSWKWTILPSQCFRWCSYTWNFNAISWDILNHNHPAKWLPGFWFMETEIIHICFLKLLKF